MKYQGVLPSKNLELTSIELPPLGPNEMRVRVRAIGVNRADLSQAEGKYPAPKGASPVLGLELSGEVEEIGGAVSEFRVGDKVMSLVAGGAYATHVNVPEESTLKLPASYSFEEGAAIPEAYFTVWSNLYWKKYLSTGDSFLVHGGTSGVGSVAVQIAKFMGVKVITTARSDQKCEACRRLGAELAICYTREDFVEKVREFTGGRGVDCILDWVGGDYYERNLAALSRRGRLVFINSHSTTEPPLLLRQIMAKEIVVTGAYLRPRPLEEKKQIKDEIVKAIWPSLEKPALRPLIYKSFALSDASLAHQVVRESSHIGKVVLIPSK